MRELFHTSWERMWVGLGAFGDGVAARDDVLHDRLLRAAELRVAKDIVEDGMRWRHWNALSLIAGGA